VAIESKTPTLSQPGENRLAVRGNSNHSSKMIFEPRQRPQVAVVVVKTHFTCVSEEALGVLNLSRRSPWLLVEK